MTGTTAVDAATRSHAIPAAGWFGVLVVFLIVCKVVGVTSFFPEGLTLDVATPVDAFADWVSETFRFLLKPSSDVMKALLKDIDRFVLGLPWLVPFIVLTLVSLAVGGWRLALLTAAILLFTGSVGLWKSSLVTLNIMILSVVLTVLMGIPLGIWAARSDRVETVIRPVLDAMQTMPTFVYLIPVMLLFGIGSTSAVIATVVYAAPPVIRLTNMGLRQVPAATIEAARSFGSTYFQELIKVRLPLARPTIMAGVNQTVMMALGMVIFVALIGAEGLGKEIWSAMRRLKIGNALEAGLVVVLLAILLDRFGYALTRRAEAFTQSDRSGATGWRAGLMTLSERMQLLARYASSGITTILVLPFRPVIGKERADAVQGILASRTILVLGCVAVAIVLLIEAYVAEIGGFPKTWKIDFTREVDDAARWMNIHLAFITDWLREVIYIYGLGPARAILLWLPWPFVFAGVCLVAWRAGGGRIVAVALAGLVFIAVTGMWSNTMVTISQVAVALLLSLLAALPLGILAAKSNRFDAVLRPVLDTMQTLPAFVYFPLVVMLFKVGDLAGIIATVIYAMPPAVRLTSLGIRQVSGSVREAARSYGSTPGQVLRKVELPLALPTIMMGINQTTIMALAMVVYAALIGSKGLGADVLLAIGRFDVGGGFTAGMSIVFLAIILDRITQGFAARYRTSLGQ